MPCKLRSTGSTAMDPESLGKMIREIVREEISTALDNKLKPIHDELGKLEITIKSCSSKVEDLETAANDMEVRMSTMEVQYKALLAENEQLKVKTDSLENHSRKFNLRILGLQQGIEAGKPTTFVDTLLYELFGEDALGPPPLVNIAHRTGPTAKDGSRCMIARLHSLELRRTIQRLVGAKGGKLNFRGHRINIYPDMTTELRKQQAEYNEVKVLFRKANLRYGIVHPAKMLVTFNNKTFSFTRPTEAMEFYEKQVRPSLSDTSSATEPTPSGP